jgi:hypothetical protein
LNACGQRDGHVGIALVDAVGNGPIVVERRKDFSDLVQDIIDTDDIEKRLLLTCK